MAAGSVRIDWQGTTAVLTLDHAPSNALSAQMRSALLVALAAVQSAGAIVICGAGTGFSSALPLDPDPGQPTLAAVSAALEGSTPPVIAALHGLVMGAGAELALAATARVAAPGTRIVLPHVALGVCPEAGTTRRLPHLVGPEAALDLMISGRAVALYEALTLGLVDARAEADPVAAAIDLARHLPARPRHDPAVWVSAIARARRAHGQALPAVGRIIACVEAALLLPPEAAQAFETVAREDLETSPQAQGLRSAARAERRAAVLPAGVAQAGAVDRIGLIGQAPALVVLAEAALAQGLAVDWAVSGQSAQASVMTAVDTALAARQRRGGLVAAARQAALARLTLMEVLPASCPLTVATAAMQGTGPVLVLDGGPGCLGLSIAPSGRASELALPAEDGVAGVAVAVATLRRIGLPPLLVSGRPGLGARVVRAGEAALRWMTDRGVPPAKVSAALERFGMVPPGPVSAPAETAPDGTAPREMAAEEILQRWLAAQANEGVRLIEAGIARHGSNIDHALVAGHGFPRWQGGPMHQADRRGLLVLRHDLRLWAAEDALWQPAPLLDRLIGRGLRLSALDG